MKFALLGLVLVGALGWGSYEAFERGLVLFNHPSLEEFPVRGIDVSHHQGKIDWAKVEAQGFHFAFIKATEGGDFVDPEFQANWAAAGQTKLKRGAYHFYTFCRKAKDQLQHIIATIPIERGAFPPVLDLEFGGNCSREPSVSEITQDLNYMVTGISRHYGREPIFYMTDEFLRKFHSPNFPDVIVWIRNVFTSPSLPDGMTWKIWQYANRGRVDGIEKVVDLNVLKGSVSDLDALVL